MTEEKGVRLSCPTCDAVYEVPAGAIPAGGRDVQCSNCGTVWFQQPDQPPAPPSGATLDREGSVAHGTRPTRPPLSEEGRRILEEEAERERGLRAARVPTASGGAAGAAGADALPARGPDSGPRPGTMADPNGAASAREAVDTLLDDRPRPRPRAGALPESEDHATTAKSGADARVSRRDRLPEISEIDPTLGRTEAVDPDDTDADDERGGGFRLGFAMALLLAALGLALYVQGPRLADAVPALKQAISSYRDGVNEVRIALDDLARTAVEALEQ